MASDPHLHALSSDAGGDELLLLHSSPAFHLAARAARASSGSGSSASSSRCHVPASRTLPQLLLPGLAWGGAGCWPSEQQQQQQQPLESAGGGMCAQGHREPPSAGASGPTLSAPALGTAASSSASPSSSLRLVVGGSETVAPAGPEAAPGSPGSREGLHRLASSLLLQSLVVGEEGGGGAGGGGDASGDFLLTGIQDMDLDLGHITDPLDLGLCANSGSRPSPPPGPPGLGQPPIRRRVDAFDRAVAAAPANSVQAAPPPVSSQVPECAGAHAWRHAAQTPALTGCSSVGGTPERRPAEECSTGASCATAALPLPSSATSGAFPLDLSSWAPEDDGNDDDGQDEEAGRWTEEMGQGDAAGVWTETGRGPAGVWTEGVDRMEEEEEADEWTEEMGQDASMLADLMLLQVEAEGPGSGSDGSGCIDVDLHLEGRTSTRCGCGSGSGSEPRSRSRSSRTGCAAAAAAGSGVRRARSSSGSTPSTSPHPLPEASVAAAAAAAVAAATAVAPSPPLQPPVCEAGLSAPWLADCQPVAGLATETGVSRGSGSSLQGAGGLADLGF